MKRRRPAFLLALSLLLPALQASHHTVLLAAPSVGEPVVSPSPVPPGQTELTVTSRIVSGPGDPVVLASGVNLLRVAADSRVLATLGRMRDDGADGDERDAIVSGELGPVRFDARRAAGLELHVAGVALRQIALVELESRIVE